MSIQLFKGNRSPSISDTVTVNGAAFDLTSATVKFQMRAEGGSAVAIDEAAVVVVAASGTVRYDPSAAFAALAAGDYVAWWQVTLPSAYKQDTAEFQVEILEHTPVVTSQLCALTDVREALELPASDRGRDRLIETYIAAASGQIIREYEREFAPVTASQLRVFDYIPNRGGLLPLTPYDLRSTSLVRLNPEEASPTTLTANTSYRLYPTNPNDSVYTHLVLNGSLTFTSTMFREFGVARVEVTGAWGYASVPAPVQQACVVTVASWLRRDFTGYANLNLDDPTQLAAELGVNYSLPPAARRLLAPYKRHSGVY